MKYFTPELHARTCSRNDAVADAAHAEWEKALARYEKRLAKIRTSFLPDVKKLTEELRLHDARLLFLGQVEGRCLLALQPEQPSQAIVWLEYALAGEPTILTDCFPAPLRISDCLLLYDEIDLISNDDRPTFSHRILFTNGLQVGLKFHDLKVQVAQQLVELPPIKGKKLIARPA